MKLKPTFEDIINSPKSKPPLQKWCKEYNIVFKIGDSVADLKKKLIKGLDLKENDFVKEVSSSLENKINFPKEESKKDNVRRDLNKETILKLSVTLDELVQYWQRGFICHPRMIKFLASTTTSHHDSSNISDLTIIDLEKQYDTNCEVVLILNNHVETKIDLNWIAPISILKSIIVFSDDQFEIIQRSLRNSNRGYYDKDCPIRKEYNKPVFYSKSLEGDKISEINIKIKEDFSLIDSLIGGFAISSFIEKKFLCEGKHHNNIISLSGCFFDSIFLDSRYSNLTGLNLISFIKDKLEGFLNLPNSNKHKYFNDVMVSICKRNDGEILNLVFEQHRREESRISPFELNRIWQAMEESLIREAIKRIPQRNPRDPFLVFYSFLNQYANTDNPAANDKQSFLFAIIELFKDKIINNEEAIIISFFLGSYLGYGMCWNPVINDYDYEWDREMPFLKLLFEERQLELILEKSIKLTSLNYQRLSEEYSRISIGNTKKVLKSKKSKTRELIILERSIELVDTDLEEFYKWRKRGKDLNLMSLVLNYRNDLSIENFVISKHESGKESERIYNEIEEKLKMGELSFVERKMINAIINL